MHQLLKLQHHRHTGKLLRHRHTSYRALLLILFLAGMLILYVTKQASADSLYVTATVPAPIPTEPAIITDPAEDAVITSSSATISGTCPVMTPAIAVVITESGGQLASGACDDTGNFAVTVQLTGGIHTLLARTLTITGDYGPDGTPVNLTFKPPANKPAGSGTIAPSGNTLTKPTHPASATQLFSVQASKPYVAFGPNKLASLTVSLSGGQAPYAASVDWGDTTVNTYKDLSAGSHTFTHRYRSISPGTIVFRAVDARGVTISVSVAALTAYIPTAPNAILSSSGGLSSSVLMGLFTAYVATLVVVGMFWGHAHRYGYAHVMVRPPRPVIHRRTVKKH